MIIDTTDETICPRYNEDLNCGFDSTRLNVAIHMRLGDIHLPFEVMSTYLSAVEELMDTVTEVVVDQGLEPPLFHVFSETMEPCPSLETNSFDEFPTWAIGSRQVKKRNHYIFQKGLSPMHFIGTTILLSRASSI